MQLDVITRLKYCYAIVLSSNTFIASTNIFFNLRDDEIGHAYCIRSNSKVVNLLTDKDYVAFHFTSVNITLMSHCLALKFFTKDIDYHLFPECISFRMALQSMSQWNDISSGSMSFPNFLQNQDLYASLISRKQGFGGVIVGKH